jgi:predicted MPP superfamily phosphohydrolase
LTLDVFGLNAVNSTQERDKMIRILHLSDIHLGTKSEANKFRIQLEADLSRELKIEKLDYIVISGDIANYSNIEEYTAAFELVSVLSKHFGVDFGCIIIVPGNHDLNWNLSEDAYYFVKKSKLPNLLPKSKYIPAGNVGALVCDEEIYKKRFDNFSKHFYEKIYGKTYPKEYSEQGILHMNSDQRILFLALNSSWEIDHYEIHHGRSGINTDAFYNALDRIKKGKEYDEWLKIAIWHHPVTGNEMMKNVDFLQQLSVHGFKVCMHGHVHEAQKGLYSYDKSRDLHIIGAGTFGAPAKAQVPGIPLQYNLLIFDPATKTITVETRKKEQPDGAWSADARWGNKNNPIPRYTINLNLNVISSLYGITPDEKSGQVKKTLIGLQGESSPPLQESLTQRFVHTQISAKGFEIENISNPYIHLYDSIDDQTPIDMSKVFCYLSLPPAQRLIAPAMETLTPVAAICSVAPWQIVKKIKNVIDNQTIQKLIKEQPSRLYKEYKEKCFNAMANEVLPNCFVAAIVIPDIILGKGHENTSFSYQAIFSHFLKPILEMHRRIGMEGFHLRISKINEIKKSFLGTTKQALKKAFPLKKTTSADFCVEGTTDDILVNMSRLLAWGVGAFYNSKNLRWISLLDIDAQQIGYGSAHLEEP